MSGTVEAGHQVLLVYDWWDTHEARAVGRLHDPLAGTTVLAVPPPGHSFDREIVEELFLALGRPGRAKLPLELPQQEPLDQALHLLEGSGARDMLIYRTQWLPAALLMRLMDIAAAADARLWLLCQPQVSDNLARGIDPCLSNVLTWETFWPAWEGRERGAPGAPPVALAPPIVRQRRPFPTVPDSDVVHFLPAAQAALTPTQYTQVLAEFDRARRSVRLGLRHDLTHALEHSSSDLTTTICQWLAVDILHSDIAISVTRLRGAQAELLRAGWHLDVNLGPFIDAHTSLPATQVRSEQAIKALTRTWRSVPGIAGPLLVALGVPEDHTWHVCLRDVARDARAVTALGRSWPVPPRARPLLTAALLARQDAGAAPEEPLITLPFLPPAPRTLSEIVDQPWRRLGILVGRHAIYGDLEPDRRRMQRLGLHLTQLPLSATPVWKAKAAPTRLPAAGNDLTVSRRLIPGPAAQRRRLNVRDAHLLSYLLRGHPLNVHDRSVVRAITGMQAAGGTFIGSAETVVPPS